MADQAKLKKRLEELLKRPENQICIDCKSRGPRWASVNLGIFFCLNCSGIHRNLGVHISFVRSVNLDSWNVRQVENMEHWGNKRGAAYYEAEVPSSYRVPREGSSVRDMERWIRDKYEFKRFVPRDGSIPAEQEEAKTDAGSSTSEEIDEPPRRTRSPRPASTRSSPRATPTSAKSPAPAAAVTPAPPSPPPAPVQDLLDFSEPEFVPAPVVAVAPVAADAAGPTGAVPYSQFGFFTESVSTSVSTSVSVTAPPGFPVVNDQQFVPGAEFGVPQHVVSPTPEAQAAVAAGDSRSKVSNEMIMSMFNPAPMQMSPHMQQHAAHMTAMPNGMGMSMGFAAAGGYPQTNGAGMTMPGMGAMPAAAPATSSPMAAPMGMPMGMHMGGMNMAGMGGGMGMGMGMAPNGGGMAMGGYPSAGQMGGFGGMGMGGGMTMGMGMGGSGGQSPAPSMMSPQAAAPQQPNMGMMGMQTYAAATPQMHMPTAGPVQMMNSHSTYAAQYSGWAHSGMATSGQPQRLA